MSENILDSINILLEKIYKSVEGNVYKILDNLLNVSSSILDDEPLKYIFKDSEKNGIIFLATSMISIFVLQYMIEKFVAMYNGKNPENVFKFIIKMLICVTFACSSKYICKMVLDINTLFTDIITSIGKDITRKEICFESFKEVVIDLEKYMSEDLISLDGVIKGFISYGAITLVINYATRYVTIIFLIIIMPIAIMFSLSPWTKGIFNSWLKLLFINLSISWVVKFILIVPISFSKINQEMFKIIIIGTICLLYKINTFVKELFGNIVAINREDYKKVF